ncbi:MAG: DUF4105 domain-containing protein, partial [Bdellovibrionales bacterium]|nr:DUF4105 domain-containing protein [Bdellovibrionales bacterium]
SDSSGRGIDERSTGAVVVRVLILILLSLALTAADAVAQSRSDVTRESYIEALVARARELQLADDPVWHTLLHYHPRKLLPGVISMADDPAFFLAPDGATNPASELEYTLRSFALEDGEPDERPVCRFRARFEWLSEALQFDPHQFPVPRCPRFEEFVTALAPSGVTLVFPTGYLNNPASMFGHTLLRIDAAGQGATTPLLAYAVNYAANTGNDGGMLFAVKGLFGGYVGSFSVEPYYERVKKYSDMEARDIWEYRLSLTSAETRRLLMHLWELRTTAFYYYFFDENCSYHILGLLEFARPGLILSEQFEWYAIPSDTVTAISDAPGLVESVEYRPALATILRSKADQLSNEALDVAVAMADGSVPVAAESLPEQPLDAARISEFAGDVANYRVLKAKEPNAEVQQRAHQLLLLRSRYGKHETFGPTPVPRVRPDEGHGVARVGIGGGMEDERWYSELQVRPAYHDLLDPQPGYLPGAEIEFFALRLRHEEQDRLELEELFPVSIVSLTPRGRLFAPFSWKIRGGLTRKRIDNSRGKYVGQVRGGMGFANEVFHHGLIYGLLDGALEVSPRYDSDNVAIGFGPSGGLLYDVTDDIRVGVTAEGIRYGLGDEHTTARISGELRLTVGRQKALRLSVARETQFGDEFSSAGLSLHHFF